MLPLYQHEAARRDLVAHFVYLAENASMATADWSLANVKTSFNQLGKNPTIGAPIALQNPALAGTRKWRVKGFDKYPIFYLVERDRVAICLGAAFIDRLVACVGFLVVPPGIAGQVLK